MNRRELLRNLGIGAAGIPLLGAGINSKNQSEETFEWTVGGDASDEQFWKRFAKSNYQVAKDFTNLENGYFGIQPKEVHRAYLDNIQKLNEYSSKYLRTAFTADYQKIVEGLATYSGAGKEELLITRNATESMNIIIQGLDLKEGDEVILHKQDYYSMIETFEMLAEQKGIKLKVIRIPLIPKSDEEILQKYEAAVTSRTKCILVTHMIHLTGQIMPVKKLCEAFKPKGIDIIVDAAHSFSQFDYKLPDLGADFVGVNLHKWFGNPLGAGLLYVKKNRIKDLKPMFGDKGAQDKIKKLGHFGTLSVPTVLTIPAAQSFNERVTISSKESRLRYLKDYWTKQAKGIDRVVIDTPLEKKRSCAIASFSIEGKLAKDVVQELSEEYGVFTVIRYLEDKNVVRVTPALYNTTADLDKLLEGIQKISKS